MDKLFAKRCSGTKAEKKSANLGKPHQPNLKQKYWFQSSEVVELYQEKYLLFMALFPILVPLCKGDKSKYKKYCITKSKKMPAKKMISEKKIENYLDVWCILSFIV